MSDVRAMETDEKDGAWALEISIKESKRVAQHGNWHGAFGRSLFDELL